MNNTYTQTIIRMPRELLRSLKQRAAREDRSLAEFMRQMAESYLLKKTKEDEFNPNDPIWQLPKKAIKTGRKNLAASVNKIVYGK